MTLILSLTIVKILPDMKTTERAMAPPCLDFRINSSVTNKNISDWTANRINTRKACCEMIDRLFNISNLGAIMKIMKFSLGQPLPTKLTKMKDMNPNEYEQIFPSGEYIAGLRNIR